jgi:hypothetical protein
VPSRKLAFGSWTQRRRNRSSGHFPARVILHRVRVRAGEREAVRPRTEMIPSVRGTSSPTGPWVWLFPLAYGLHIAEEYAFHFPAYVANLSGRHISIAQFLVINAIFWILMFGTVVLVLARLTQPWLIVTLAAVLGINAALHIVASVVTFTYSPGTVTAAFLYVPLVVFALRRILPHVSRRVAVRAAALGAVIHAGVILLVANRSFIPSP